jgi:hypothetical protein
MDSSFGIAEFPAGTRYISLKHIFQTGSVVHSNIAAEERI